MFGDTGETIGHVLYVGVLSAGEPTARIPLVESPWLFTSFATQTPVTAGPAGGIVLYVSDDGISSELRIVNVDGTDDRTIGSIPEVVFTAALGPGGAEAYLVLLDRATGREQGVVRIGTDGSSSPTKIMDPAIGTQPAFAVGMVLAAVSRFAIALFPSPDGRQLARVACGPTACLLEVADLTSGAIAAFRNPPILEFFGLADGIMVGRFDCRDACPDSLPTDVVEIATLQRVRLAPDVGTRVATGADGRLILLGQKAAAVGNPGPDIHATDVRTGATRTLISLDGALLPEIDPVRLGVELPMGWQWIGLCDAQDSCPLAFNLVDGSTVLLADFPSLPDEGAGHD